MTDTQQFTSGQQPGSGQSTASQGAGMGKLSLRCEVCQRDNVILYKYSYGISKETTNFNRNPIVQDNPDALTSLVCGTDQALLVRIKNDTKMNPKEVLAKAIEYRKDHSIKST